VTKEYNIHSDTGIDGNFFCSVFLDLSCVEFIEFVALCISCNVPMTVEWESENFLKVYDG